MRLGTPCAGFEAPYFALRELGVQHFEHVFSIDVGSHAAKFCKNLNHAKKTWLGQQEGDLMTLDFTQVPSVDILVAGPPCQPFSMMGRRDGIRDPRAGVFWRTIDLIAELARRPGEEALRCFILENVDGVKTPDVHGCRGIDEITRRLRVAAPAFTVRVYDMNSKDYSLPQNRQRVYFVGVHKSMQMRKRTFCTPPKHESGPKLEDWLVKHDHVPDRFKEVPQSLKSKKRKFDEKLQAEMSKLPWRVACAEIHRHVDGGFGGRICTDIVGTILSSSPISSWLWIRDGEQVTERFLLPVEQLHVQGFPSRDPQLAKALFGLRDQEVITGAGNAMSVPVIGSVLADIFVKTLVGRLDAAMEVSDSEDDADGESSQGPTFPRFRCGCWLHLRSLPEGPGGAMGDVSVHSGRRSQKLVLGRDPRRASALLLEADRLQETSVISRVHAELIPGSQPGEAFVRDLGSTNGSWILGRGRICAQNVEMEVLCGGDEISLGVDPSTWQEGHSTPSYRFLYRVEMPTKRRRTEAAETPSPAPEPEELAEEQDPEPPLNEEPVFPSAAAAIAALESLEHER